MSNLHNAATNYACIVNTHLSLDKQKSMESLLFKLKHDVAKSDDLAVRTQSFCNAVDRYINPNKDNRLPITKDEIVQAMKQLRAVLKDAGY